MIIIQASKAFLPWQKKVVFTILRQNGVVVYPTETSYGFGADWTSALASEAVYKLKDRSACKDLSVIVDGLTVARQWVRMNSAASHIVRSFWPGPLTLVLPLYRQPTHIHTPTLALRQSSQPIAQTLARTLARPLISTSANRSGQPPITNIEEFFQQFRKQTYWPDCFINAGAIPRQPASTILQVSETKYSILREGVYKKEDLESFF